MKRNGAVALNCNRDEQPPENSKRSRIDRGAVCALGDANAIDPSAFTSFEPPDVSSSSGNIGAPKPIALS
jgi:hypothetical protein